MYADPTPQGDGTRPPVDVCPPKQQLQAVIYASPHSGRYYPPELCAATRLELRRLRRSEDSFVDEIFAAAPERGAPLLKALFARAYCDPNREAYELDPAMFKDPLPSFVNTASIKVAGGLGTIARIAGSGEEIYSRKLTFAEAEQRIADCYRPYHRSLQELVKVTQRHFGFAIILDCHSMPSTDGHDTETRPDFVLGDRFGTACAPGLIEIVRSVLEAQGYSVARNWPYAGGFTTQHYGRPNRGLHTLQIEINRALYMDEEAIEPTAGLPRLAAHMAALIETLERLDPALFTPAVA